MTSSLHAAAQTNLKVHLHSAFPELEKYPTRSEVRHFEEQILCIVLDAKDSSSEVVPSTEQPMDEKPWPKLDVRGRQNLCFHRSIQMIQWVIEALSTISLNPDMQDP